MVDVPGIGKAIKNISKNMMLSVLILYQISYYLCLLSIAKEKNALKVLLFLWKSPDELTIILKKLSSESRNISVLSWSINTLYYRTVIFSRVCFFITNAEKTMSNRLNSYYSETKYVTKTM